MYVKLFHEQCSRLCILYISIRWMLYLYRLIDMYYMYTRIELCVTAKQYLYLCLKLC
jgi:hypothetical protein